MAQSKLPYITAIDPNYQPKYYSRKNLSRLLRERTLVNLSQYQPSPAEIETLLLGPKTILKTKTNEPLSGIQMGKAADRMARQIDLVHFFDHNKQDRYRNLFPNTDTTNRGHLADLVKSTWVPPPATWRARTAKRLAALRKTKRIDNPEYSDPCIVQALKNLRTQKIAYILPADKGGATVLINREDYVKEAMHQLRDRNNYLPMTKRKFEKRIRQLDSQSKFLAMGLHRLKLITDAEFRAIRAHKPDGTKIYFLIKIHKKDNPATGTKPGRPIAAAFNSPLRFLDKYLANIFSYILPRMPGSLNDTTHLISKLPMRSIPQNSTIVTADVNALYPSIPIPEGIRASVRFYEENFGYLSSLFSAKNLPPPPPSNYVSEILELILTGSLINFQNGAFFQQINGTAMGISISVYFANCYMYELTRDRIDNPPEGIIFFERFIDDIIVIADNNRPDAFIPLFQSISNQHISYTVDPPGRTCNFLDLTINLTDKNTIETVPFFKPTSTFSFVHSKSDHPPHCIASLPISQFTRLRRNTSDPERFPAIAKKLARAFLIRGYNPSRLELQNDHITKKTQAQLITRRIRTNAISSLKFIFPYSGDIDFQHIRRNLGLLMGQILSGLSLHSDIASTIRGTKPALVNSKKIAILNSLTKPYKNPEPTTLVPPYLGPRRPGRRQHKRNTANTTLRLDEH